MSYDGLLRFSVEEFGEPVECDGSVTDEFDGARYGIVSFRFRGGATFTVETMPPSLRIATLLDAGGFDESDRIVEAARRYASDLGLAIVWESPERSNEGAEVTEQFWDPDPGLNGSVSFTRASESLVSVRVSMAP